MFDTEFNLLREQWIVVMKHDGSMHEVSLCDLFRNAHLYKGLAGELPTQDVAVLRLLLAILHAVFGRKDRSDGEQSPLFMLKRWKALWDKGEFQVDIIDEYLNRYEDRFWLFHPTHPFFQVAGIKKSTDYTAAKLNGILSESSNKIRLFPQRAGSGKKELTFSEAVRWLLYVNAFDDTSAKPTIRKNMEQGNDEERKSPGAGWLGKLGLITAVGDNLYETLLLNFVLLRDGSDTLWGDEDPVWERDYVKADERTEIAIPDNPSALLTLQSRRLYLKRNGSMVVGFSLLGGDFFHRIMRSQSR